MTIQEVIDLINARLQGGQARGTLDTFKCGDPSEPVRGIVVTFMATCEVIERAAELGANLLITHEPTFYNHADETGWLSGDGVFLSKQSLIESHGIAIWRFHDGCHEQRLDYIVSGMAQKLGWEFDPEPCGRNTFTIKPQTARSVAQCRLPGPSGLKAVKPSGAKICACLAPMKLPYCPGR